MNSLLCLDQAPKANQEKLALLLNAIQWKLDQNKPLGIMRLLNCDFTMRDQKGAQDIGH